MSEAPQLHQNPFEKPSKEKYALFSVRARARRSPQPQSAAKESASPATEAAAPASLPTKAAEPVSTESTPPLLRDQGRNSNLALGFRPCPKSRRRCCLSAAPPPGHCRATAGPLPSHCLPTATASPLPPHGPMPGHWPLPFHCVSGAEAAPVTHTIGICQDRLRVGSRPAHAPELWILYELLRIKSTLWTLVRAHELASTASSRFRRCPRGSGGSFPKLPLPGAVAVRTHFESVNTTCAS